MLQHQARVTVVHDESGFSFGVGRGKSGGGKTGDNQAIRPGGMAPPRAFAGTYEFEELTWSRLLEHTVDSGLVQRAYDLHGDRFTIVEQPLDEKGRPGFHKPVTYTGRLNGSTPPEYDADGNDPTTLELTFTIDGVL